MNEIKRLDKRGYMRQRGGIKGIEYRLIEGLRSKEERKRIIEGIGTEIIMKRGEIRQTEKETKG